MSHDCKSIPCDVCDGGICPECKTFCSTFDEDLRLFIHYECVGSYRGGRAEYFADDAA